MSQGRIVNFWEYKRRAEGGARPYSPFDAYEPYVTAVREQPESVALILSMTHTLLSVLSAGFEQEDGLTDHQIQLIAGFTTGLESYYEAMGIPEASIPPPEEQVAGPTPQ